jgi:PadR family transcriptional regulator PadR
MTTPDSKLLTREILLGFWKVHILHHAAEHPIVGQWVLTELRRHGYDISPGTMYPLLKRMERNGWLRCEADAGAGPRGRRYYHLTRNGSAVLDSLREAVVELHHEVIEESSKRPHKAGMLLSVGRMPGGDTAGRRGRNRTRTKAGRRTR